ncbi:response regulator [Alteromonas facilis]|uniref:response regulator n=1 Tax=Alteromonas facilis TaxID=2048004 RepID=UPI000C288144|nr:response regulator [Alteromonas facilis]
MHEKQTVSLSKFERERKARREAENLLESKSRELYEKNTALEALRDSLEEQVAERTKEILKLKDEALDAYKVKSVFLQNISHELKTPLNAVVGFAEQLNETKLDAGERQRATDIILKNSMFLADLLDELLEISSNDKPTQIKIAPFNIKRLLEAIHFRFSTAASVKGVKLNFDWPNSFPDFIESDERAVKRVITQLIDNAIRHTEAGTVKLKITLDNALKEIEFCIKSSGVAVWDEYGANVRSNKRLSEQDDARGSLSVGLPIATHLASLLEGSISVESEARNGSQCVFRFPIKLNDKEDGDRSALKEPDTNYLSGHVLVVEDNPVNLEITLQLLSHTGAEVDVASNGEVGLQKILAGNFDLILMDIQMPILDGLQVTQMLRGLGYKKPIVAVTANFMKKDIEEYVRKGFDDVVVKPIEKKLFFKVLQNYLSNSKRKPCAVREVSEEKQRHLEALFINSLGNYKDAILRYLEDKQLNSQLHQLKGVCGNFTYSDLTNVVDQAHDLNKEMQGLLAKLCNEIDKVLEQ